MASCGKNRPPSEYTQAGGNAGGDLNKDSGGCFEYIYYSKEDSKSCYTKIDVAYGQYYTPPAGYKKLGNDLNYGAGGEYIWLIGKLEPLNSEEQSIKSESSTTSLIKKYLRIE